MSRSLIILVFLIFAICHGNSQTDLQTLNQLRLNTNRQSMFVLGGWAVANIGVGAVLRSQTNGATRYFHEGNVGWNLVNLGLAAGSLIGTRNARAGDFDEYDTFREQQKIERLLLFNSGLDLAYMASGAYLIERSKTANDHPERLKGYGQALMLQGGFLFLFDLTTYLLHRSHSLQYYQVRLSASHGQVGLNLRF